MSEPYYSSCCGMTYPKHFADCPEIWALRQSIHDDLWESTPDCDGEVVHAAGGGVKCTKCRGWFCL